MSIDILFKKASEEEERIVSRAMREKGPHARGREPKWPFVCMLVGDSVVVPDAHLGRAESACKAASRNKGFRFFKAKAPGGTVFKRIE